ncbi:hypothetical protein EDD22DRAFT_946567, partial [Suillus occidentalis]
MLMCQQKTAGSRPEVSKSPISRPEAMQTSGSRPEVIEPTDDTAGASDGEPPAIPTFDITGSWPNWHCETRVDRRTGHPCLSCLRCATKKIKCHPVSVGSPPKCRTRSKTPAPAPSTGPQSHGSSSVAVPHAALNVPMPDLHSMAIAIRDGAARITILEAHIDTLQHLHESLQAPGRSTGTPHFHFWTYLPMQPCCWINPFPLRPCHPLPSALPNLINLDMGVMEPTPLKVEDTSDMVGLVFEPSQVQPEGPQSSGEIVVLVSCME